MRIATWNVNSLKARQEKVWWWLDRAQPDVLLLQETKVADAAVPTDGFTERGYELAHHGDGRWNGVAIASRVGLEGVVTNFGEPLREGLEAEHIDAPLGETRMIAARCGGVNVVSLYVPNGRQVGSPFYESKLAWLRRLESWLGASHEPSSPLLVGGDLNIALTDDDVWDPERCHGGTHVSEPERGALRRLLEWGLVDGYRALHPERERYTWWDYRAGMFHKNYGMRIDYLLLTAPLRERLVDSLIDREARKGKPTPSDHAPLLVDLDSPGTPIDPGWKGALKRIASRRER